MSWNFFFWDFHVYISQLFPLQKEKKRKSDVALYCSWLTCPAVSKWRYSTKSKFLPFIGKSMENIYEILWNVHICHIKLGISRSCTGLDQIIQPYPPCSASHLRGMGYCRGQMHCHICCRCLTPPWERGDRPADVNGAPVAPNRLDGGRISAWTVKLPFSGGYSIHEITNLGSTIL